VKKKTTTFKAYKILHGAAKAAANCGVSTVTYWRWETGKTKPEGNDAKRVAELGLVRA
jgi:DNA-binding XRE family transcriptional regulator